MGDTEEQPDTTAPDVTVDVVVLGGGVAGLAAARALRERGQRVIVVEARPRLGGRILTRRESGCPWPIELGAEFAHGDPPLLRRLARAAGLTTLDTRFAMATLGPDQGGGQLMTDAVARLVEQAEKRSPGDLSVGAFLAQLMAENEVWGERREAIRQYVNGFHAADLERMSVAALVTEESTRGQGEGADQRWVEGYDRLVDHLASVLPAEQVWLRTAARRLDWSRGQVRVTTLTDARHERVIAASAAVVALPLGVLQAPGDEPGAVRFVPEPTAAREAIGRLAFGAAHHVVLHFARAFWEDEKRGDQHPWRDLSFFRIPGAPLPVWWTRLPLRTTLLTAWVGGPDAARLAGLSTGEIQELALASLGRAFGRTADELRGELWSCHFHDWSSDPFARGAYSYVPVGGLGAQAELAKPVEDTLFFAGEATHEGGDTGTVHGAIETGERAARLILERVGTSRT